MTHPPDDLSLGRLVYEIGQIWRFRIDSTLQSFGLSRAKWHVIMALSKAPAEGISQRELARICYVEPPSMAGLLERMENEGWIRRVTSPSDRRSKLTLLNDKARSIHNEIVAASHDVELEVFENLSTKSYEQIKKSLGDLLDVLEKTASTSKNGATA